MSYLTVFPNGLQIFAMNWSIPFTLPILFTVLFPFLGFTRETAAFMISACFLGTGVSCLTQNNRFSVNLPVPTAPGILYLPLMIAGVFLAGFPTTLLGMSIGCIISAFVFCLPHKKYGLIGYILPTLSAPPVVGSFLTFMGAALIYYVTMPNIFGRGPWNYITGTALRNNIIVFALTCAFTIALFIGLRKRGAQGIVRGICVLLGLLFGIIVAAALGITDFSPIATAPWFALPKLFIGFNLGSIDMLALGSIIAMTIVANLSDLADTIGAYATAERMYPEGSTGLNIERTNRGVFFKMLWSGIAVLFGAQPTVAYPERVVLIQMSGVWSNKQITWVGVMMIISGLIYKVGMFGASIPPAVLAATTIISMSMLTYAGIRIITYMEFTDRNMMIVGFSICAGMLCLIMPTWFQDSLPYFLNIFFGSAILVCFVVAWIMYIFLSYLPARRKKTS